MSSRQAAPQLGWAVCSGEWHVRAGECLQHDTGSIFLFDWLTHSLQKPQKVLDLESRSYVSYGKLPFHMVFVSDLNRYRLSCTHSYARSFLFPSNFSCFYLTSKYKIIYIFPQDKGPAIYYILNFINRDTLNQWSSFGHRQYWTFFDNFLSFKNISP